MEILLTLESVVVNLAECLKNSDLMAALTRQATFYLLISYSVHSPIRNLSNAQHKDQ